MYNDDYFEYIFKRKSCRKFKSDKIDEDMLQELQTFINQLIPLEKNIKTMIKIVDNNAMKGVIGSTGLHNAPYYLNFYSETNDLAYLNCGFMMQQIDLFLAKKGLGSCYVGMARPKIDLETELEFIMTLAIGKASEKLHRDQLSEFKRKTILEITNFEVEPTQSEIWQAVKLAPSAVNFQPWFFTKASDSYNVYCKKNNIMKMLGKTNLNKIDIGIALCHLAIACHKFGYGFKFVFDTNLEQIEGCYPIGQIISDLQ